MLRVHVLMSVGIQHQRGGKFPFSGVSLITSSMRLFAADVFFAVYGIQRCGCSVVQYLGETAIWSFR